MDGKTFLIKDVLKTGWQVVTGRFWFFVGVFAAAMALAVIPNALVGEISNKWVSVPLSLLSRLWSAYLTLGVLLIAIRSAKGEKPSFSLLFGGGFVFVKYILASLSFYALSLLCQLPFIVIAIVILVASKVDLTQISTDPSVFSSLGGGVIAGLVFLLLALVAVSVALGLIFGYYPFFVVDRGEGPIQSLKSSSAMTRGVRWKLLLFIVTLLGVNLLGLLSLFVGLLFTGPLSVIATVSVYLRLAPPLEESPFN